MTLDDNLALERMGLLRHKQGALLADPRVSKLNEHERELLVLIYISHKKTMCRSSLRSPALKDAAETLELMGHVTWERDNHGKPAYLTLTWKGDELAPVLMHSCAGSAELDG